MDQITAYSHIPPLLAKAAVGKLSPEEEAELWQWREENDVHAALYEEVMAPLFFRGKLETVTAEEVSDAYLKVMALRKKNHRKRMLRRMLSVSAAAVFLIAGLISWLIYRVPEVSEFPQRMEISHGEPKAELIFDDGFRMALDTSMEDSLLIREGAQIRLEGMKVSYEDAQSQGEIRFNTLKVPRGGEFSVTLNDGSVVRLNSETQLRYPVRFSGEERKVYLTGEAYFEVKGDAEHPFVVELLDGLQVRVLGTAFNIRAYRGDPEIATTLVEGEVQLSSAVKETLLQPGEQGLFGASGEIRKKMVDVNLYTAWKDGMFAFRRQSLEDIMKSISRWYDVEVIWENPSLKEITFSGKMKRYDNFSKVVEMLGMTDSTAFEIKDRTIIIRER